MSFDLVRWLWIERAATERVSLAEYEPDSKGGKRVVKYKFAFQWCEGQGEPWWNANSSTEHSSLSEDSGSRPTQPEDGMDLESEADATPGRYSG